MNYHPAPNMLRRLAGLVLIALVACSSMTTTFQHTAAVRGKARWVVLPFANYSETPQAGERVEAIVDTLLRRQGISTLDRYPALKEDDAHLIISDRQRYEESLAWAVTQKYDYGVAGSVEEWRYKSGVDGDPAVGLTVRVVELSTNRVVWSASGTRGGSGDTASGAALKLLDAMVLDLSGS
jgi:polysaccharide biosynthesis protein PelC